LPELDVIASRLNSLLQGKTIRKAVVYNHLVLHGIEVRHFEDELTGKVYEAVRADGKFLLISLENEHEIVVNPMLAGRFRLMERPKRPSKTDIFHLHSENWTLRYTDRKQMSRVYLVKGGDYSQVAEFNGRGPSALGPELKLAEFKQHLRRRRGQIKNILRNQRFVKGIGNAYADEILLYAGILPFRRKSSLSDEEVEQLYDAMRNVLMKFKGILEKRSLDEIALEKRDFMMVHNRGGGVCPLCGGRISEVTANRFKTNYCQTRQK